MKVISPSPFLTLSFDTSKLLFLHKRVVVPYSFTFDLMPLTSRWAETMEVWT